MTLRRTLEAAKTEITSLRQRCERLQIIADTVEVFRQVASGQRPDRGGGMWEDPLWMLGNELAEMDQREKALIPEVTVTPVPGSKRSKTWKKI